MHPDRLFSPDPATRGYARELYQTVAALPLICPHGHVDPQLFSSPAASFGSPADLFIIPDHYITRILYSQGVPLEALGVPREDGGTFETDHRKIWRTFCEHFYLFRGTPSGLWLMSELSEVFGIDTPPSLESADHLYDLIDEKLASPEFTPRRLFEHFNIEVLATTDAATDTLEHHEAIRQSGWGGRIPPTFRPDALMTLDDPGWRLHLDRLSQVSGVDVVDYHSYIQALEQRREAFRSLGATATDHGVLVPDTVILSLIELGAIFQRAMHGQSSAAEFGVLYGFHASGNGAHEHRRWTGHANPPRLTA